MRDDDGATGFGFGLRLGDDDVERYGLAPQNLRAGIARESADQDGVARVLAHADTQLRVLVDSAVSEVCDELRG